GHAEALQPRPQLPHASRRRPVEEQAHSEGHASSVPLWPRHRQQAAGQPAAIIPIPTSTTTAPISRRTGFGSRYSHHASSDPITIEDSRTGATNDTGVVCIAISTST